MILPTTFFHLNQLLAKVLTMAADVKRSILFKIMLTKKKIEILLDF